VRLFRRLFAGLVAALAVSLLTFVVIEGASSVAIFFFQLFKRESLAGERPAYVRYDPELGWTSKPNVAIPNMYGKGIYFHTNARGFRGVREVTDDPPPRKVRVVCSGDSFTMGHGVDDDHTWCHLIGTIDPRLETINMGQSGYGLDQAFLAYRRDGAKLGADVHLFAFIGQDVYRMLRNGFFGYGRPVLAVRDGRLIVENTPVPERPWFAPALIPVAPAVRQLRTFQLVSRARWRLSGETNVDGEGAVAKLTLEVFEKLVQMADEVQGVLVIVYLPEREECLGGWPTGYRMGLLAKQAALSLGVQLIDLTQECQALGAEDVEALFIHKNEVDDPNAAGHYSALGNEFVAQAILRKLADLPAVATTIERLAPASTH
jgi:hypothetical protein